MTRIDGILRSAIKPKEKQVKLVEAVVSGAVPVEEFLAFFKSAGSAGKGTCADVMKHVAGKKPALLAPYMDMLIEYINCELPRVKWGVPEAIGNMAESFPVEAARAVPHLLRNTTDDKANTTVVKWCAAFALAEIAKHNPEARRQLVPVFEEIIRREPNNGVRNVYVKAVKTIKGEP